jgi:hypothetical protein
MGGRSRPDTSIPATEITAPILLFKLYRGKFPNELSAAENDSGPSPLQFILLLECAVDFLNFLFPSTREHDL